MASTSTSSGRANFQLLFCYPVTGDCKPHVCQMLHEFKKPCDIK